MITPELSAALDRTNVSHRNATFIVAAVVSSLGMNIEDVKLNRETVRTSRINLRKTAAKKIQNDFIASVPLTVHWDGKLAPDLVGSGKCERTAILVTGKDIEKLLGVPKSDDSTGETQATVVFEKLKEWNLLNDVTSMCFDTTASNTGVRAGACVLLEKKLGRKMLHLACRHHVLELIIAKVHDKLFEVSTGPNIQLFNTFRNQWSGLEKENYVSGLDDQKICSVLSIYKSELVIFVRNQIKEHQQRNDYKELLNLILIFLGEKPSKNYVIMAPGAFHRARWMAKLIYCLKIYLFRFECEVEEKVLDALRDFNLFIVIVYVKYWFKCPSSTSAPYNDLSLVKDILAYKEINESIANAAFSSFQNHLWYLSEKLIGLSFFDSEIDTITKQKMVKNLSRVGSKLPLNRIKATDEEDWSDKKIEDFVFNSTLDFFKMLKINTDFLKKNPKFWKNDPQYVSAQIIVQNLKVR